MRLAGWLEVARRLPVVGRQLRSMEKARMRRRIAESADAKAAFAAIHQANYWGSGESVSGNGSTLASTELLRAELTALIAELGVGCLFDAPCGDFNWMRLVRLPDEAHYIGADIVDAIIADCAARYAAPNREFRVVDIIRDPHPRADLWLCRDALLHLSNRDIRAALERFVESGTALCLLTTYPDISVNRDVRTGLTRHINLLAPPFSLPPAGRYLRDAPVGEGPRLLGLWTRAQIAGALAGDAPGG
ncbi:MAG: hypothetical protein KGI51_07850 [Rhodospirillales bacterium]|nr:hypothetical protein [Rhodospirillales bacterium]